MYFKQMITIFSYVTGFQVDSIVKNPPANAGDLGSIPGLGRPPGGGCGNPLQSSCLENLMDRGAQWDIVHWGHEESDTKRLNT